VVTGGAGFIGSRLGRALIGRGDEVVVVDLLPGPEGTESILASVLDLDALTAAFEGADAVIHLAGLVRAGIRKDPAAGATLQLQGTVNVLEACASHGVGRLAIASSFYVYDGLPDDSLVDESTALDPRRMELFGSVKLMSEALCERWAEGSALGVVSLRYGPAYGGGGSSAVDEFVSAGVMGQPVTVWGSGTRRNQYTHVDDLVGGTVAALDHPGKTFNLVAPTAWSMRELAELVAREHGLEYSFDGARPEGPRLPRISSARAIEQLAWSPVSLPDGVRRTVTESVAGS
jgi:UDP-glucose 4-epimerase